MATVTCTRVDIFPNATVIKCFERTAFSPFQAGEPHGKKVTEATMTSGTCSFEGLVAGQEYTLWAEVGGKDAVLGVQAPPSAGLVAMNGSSEPALQKLLAWSFDPIAASATFGLTTAGTLYGARLPIKESMKVTNILQFLTTKGATLTAGENFIGLFAEGTRALLGHATAAETISKWEGTNGSLLTIPLETPVVIGPGNAIVAMYYKGTTKPTFSAGVETAAAQINAGVEGKNLRFFSGDTGLTTALPNPITETLTATASPLWVALS